MKYKMALVPDGVECTATSARVGLQESLDHTAKRLAERPDMKEYFENAEEDEVKEFVHKWGGDGQTGFAAYARSKEHDDRMCINEGVSLIMVSLNEFLISISQMNCCQARDLDSKEVFFDHDKSGGIEMFRPLSKVSGKENDDAIVATIARIQAEVAALEDTVVLTANGKSIRVRHTVLYTMLDGKCRFVCAFNNLFLL